MAHTQLGVPLPPLSLPLLVLPPLVLPPLLPLAAPLVLLLLPLPLTGASELKHSDVTPFKM